MLRDCVKGPFCSGLNGLNGGWNKSHQPVLAIYQVKAGISVVSSVHVSLSQLKSSTVCALCIINCLLTAALVFGVCNAFFISSGSDLYHCCSCQLAVLSVQLFSGARVANNVTAACIQHAVRPL